MYLSYFNLKTKPFSISPDPNFMWLGPNHQEGLAVLKYGILDDKGFLALTGDVGTGKTALIKRLIKTVGVAAIVVTVPDPGMEKLDFYNYLADEFNMSQTFKSKGDFLIAFKHFLLKAYSSDRKVLLIIDEAQRLSHELLEEIRVLSNIEKDDMKLINIFFVGQNEFKEMLMEERNKAVRQRISVNYHIDPLTEDETRQYIRHRLMVAGATDDIFNLGAISAVYSFSKGYPRLINIMCDNALLTAYSSDLKIVDMDVVKECEGDLRIPVYTNEANTPETIQMQRNETDDVEAEPPVVSLPPLPKRPRRIMPALAAVAVIFACFIGYQVFSKVMKGDSLSLFISGLSDKAVKVISGGQEAGSSAIPALTELTKNEIGRESSAEKIVLTQKFERTSIYSNGKQNEFGHEPPTDYSIEDRLENVSAAPEPKIINAGLISDVKEPIADVGDSATGRQDTAPYAAQNYTIYFKLNSDELPFQALETLDKIAKYASTLSTAAITVRGYTDSYGNYWYNKKLSESRAGIVKDYFVEKGIFPRKITSVGMGSDNPIESNETLDGRRRNRRVEIVLNLGG